MKKKLTVAVACIAALLFTINNAQAQITWSKVYTASSNDVGSFCETSTGNIFGLRDNRFLLKSTNSGSSWAQFTPTSGYPTTNYNDLAAYQNNLYLINYNTSPSPYLGKGFFLSTDQGVTWTKKINGLGTDTVTVGINVTKNGTLYVTSLIKVSGLNKFKVYRSIDNGSTWTFTLQLDHAIYSFDETSAGTYFMNDGYDMYTSSNGSSTWTKLTQTSDIFLSQFVIASNDSIYMHSSNKGFARSLDGINWDIITRTGWPSGQVGNAFLITPKDTMFTTVTTAPDTDDGVYISTNLGKAWTKINTGLPTNPDIFPYQFWLSEKTGYLFSGIYLYGIYRTTTRVYTATGVPTSVFAPVDYSDKLGLTISPNPATEVTTIEYTLGSSDFVSIDITDQSGNVVKTVLNQSAQSAGTHKQAIELNGIKAGLYFVSVNSGTGRSVKKIVVH